MNGWQRLWILLSGIYLVAVIVFAIALFPEPESMSHTQEFYDQLTPELRQKVIGNKNSESFRNEER